MELLYKHGKCVSRDPASAQSWFKRAADNGNIMAMYALAVSCSESAASAPDYGNAAKWFERAANFGGNGCQFDIALIQTCGLGVSQVLPSFCKWFALVAKQGDSDTVGKRNTIRSARSGAETAQPSELMIREAQRLLNARIMTPAALTAGSVRVPKTRSAQRSLRRSCRRLGKRGAKRLICALTNTRSRVLTPEDAILGTLPRELIPMLIYLPIAEIPVNVLIILGMGGTVGFISGMFGVGGGFLLTPLLIFTGVPPAVAVASVTSQIVASSTSGALVHWRRKFVDLPLALVLLGAGSVGSVVGVVLFDYLRTIGQLDPVLSLSYVTFLGFIGVLMLVESVNAIRRRQSGQRPRGRRPGQHNWVHKLPWKVRFRRSKLYISVIPVIALGGSIGFLGTMLGIGGGFIMVPALIYLLRVPTSVVIGTSLIQILGTMAIATVLHSVTTGTVDVVLALALMIGGVIGAQMGARLGQNVPREQLRLFLSLIVLSVGVRFLVDLVIMPTELYSVNVLERALR